MRIAAKLAGAVVGAVAIGLPCGPSASADPGDPIPGCEKQVFVSYCDGPVRADGTWMRCMDAAPSPEYGPEGYVTGWTEPYHHCFDYDPAFPPLLPGGQPNHHIDQ